MFQVKISVVLPFFVEAKLYTDLREIKVIKLIMIIMDLNDLPDFYM